MDSICLICGKKNRQSSLISLGGDAETCCGVCRKALAKARNSVEQYFERHKRGGATGECIVCGEPTEVASSSGRPHKYCSDECRYKRFAKEPLAPRVSATLDRIVPLSRGGDHIESNVRTAHWCCNRAKHGKLDEEMRCPAGDHQNQPQT